MFAKTSSSTETREVEAEAEVVAGFDVDDVPDVDEDAGEVAAAGEDGDGGELEDSPQPLAIAMQIKAPVAKIGPANPPRIQCKPAAISAFMQQPAYAD